MKALVFIISVCKKAQRKVEIAGQLMPLSNWPQRAFPFLRLFAVRWVDAAALLSGWRSVRFSNRRSRGGRRFRFADGMRAHSVTDQEIDPAVRLGLGDVAMSGLA